MANKSSWISYMEKRWCPGTPKHYRAISKAWAKVGAHIPQLKLNRLFERSPHLIDHKSHAVTHGA